MTSVKLTPRNEREEQCVGKALNRLLNAMIAEEKKKEQQVQATNKGA